MCPLSCLRAYDTWRVAYTPVPPSHPRHTYTAQRCVAGHRCEAIRIGLRYCCRYVAWRWRQYVSPKRRCLPTHNTITGMITSRLRALSLACTLGCSFNDAAIVETIQRWMINACEAVGEMKTGRGNLSTRRESNPVLLTSEWSDPTCRNLPWFSFHCKSTHNKIHCQNFSC
jgi:hypothetical protein